MAVKGEWHDGSDLKPPSVVLRPSSAQIATASRMNEAGVEKVVMLEIEGNHDGHPYRFGIDLPLDAADMIGEALREAKDQ